MWCDQCSKKYDETGHVCFTTTKPNQVVKINISKPLHYESPRCSFVNCNQKATESIGNLNACEDHAEDALAHRDNQQERGK